MKELIEKLNEHLAVYVGEGVNHEDEKFIGVLEISPVVGGLGFNITYRACALENVDEVFHTETSLITPNAHGGYSMFNFNSNSPFMLEHECVTAEQVGEELHFVFRFNDSDESEKFREEVRLEILNSDQVRYAYAWGLPGEEFADRSSAIMTK